MRFSIIALVLVLLAGLAACGSNSTPPPRSPPRQLPRHKRLQMPRPKKL